jgi:hypothetical protein
MSLKPLLDAVHDVSPIWYAAALFAMCVFVFIVVDAHRNRKKRPRSRNCKW